MQGKGFATQVTVLCRAAPDAYAASSVTVLLLILRDAKAGGDVGSERIGGPMVI